MLSLSWPRWFIARFGKKSRPHRQIKRLHVSLTLELLEHRDLLTTATPFVVTLTPQDASPLGDPGSSGYTPNQISRAYGFDKITFGNGTVKGDGSGQTIAIVSAYNDPNIANDLLAFDQHFDLPSASLSVINQTGGTVLPETDPTGAWEAEDALDVEWAHAMAPGANLVLVEANSDDMTDLLASAHTAAALPSVSVVSMSWGNAEFAEETNYDSIFTTPDGHGGVTFVAASGDNGAPPVYPAVSPNVLAVGGTTLTLDSQGDYVSETAWSGSGGGISAYEPQPSYQKGVASQSATMRTNPDVAYDANSETGFAVYDSYQTTAGASPWIVMAGTSAGAPQWAALIAIANQGRALADEAALDGPSQTLPAIYQMPSRNFHDIVSGSSLGTPSYSAGPGYDLVTGRGSPFADQVVYYLVGVSGSPPNPSSSGSPSGPSPGPSAPPPAPTGGNLVSDGSFESPSLGGVVLTDPTGSPWTFLGASGIAGNGSTLTAGNAPAPDGGQVAFLSQTGSILQSVNLAAGLYSISFQAAQAGIDPNSLEGIEVIVGGIVVVVVTPGLSYSTYSETFNVPSSGNQTLQFQGEATSQDSTALLDGVVVQSESPGSTPVSPPPSPSPPPSSPASPPPSPTPSPSLSPPPSSQSPGGQASVPTDQSTPDSLDALIQSVLTEWYNLLLDEMMLLEAEWTQLLQMSSNTALVPINSGTDGPPQ